MLLLHPRHRASTTEPPPTEKRRNKTGISRIFKRNMEVGQKITLSEAIELLRAKW